VTGSIEGEEDGMLSRLRGLRRQKDDHTYELLPSEHSSNQLSARKILNSKLALRLSILLLVLLSSAGTILLLLRRATSMRETASKGEIGSPTPTHIPIAAIASQACAAQRTHLAEVAKQVSPKKPLVFQGTALPELNLTLSLHPTLRDTEGCYTSVDRYSPYLDANITFPLPSQCGNTHVLVVRLEPDHLYTDDFNAHLSALITEVAMPNAMDVRILQQFSTQEQKDAEAPPLFRSLVTKFHHDEVFAAFPQHRKHINMPSFNLDSHPGRYVTRYMHVVDIFVFNKFQEYEFAWFLDAKVRSTGSWSLQFEPLIEAIQAEERSPDLVTLDPILSAPAKAHWQGLEKWRPEHYVTSEVIIHGISRRMSNAMSSYLHDGYNAIAEAFIPAIAIKHQVFRILIWPHTCARKTTSQLGFSSWRPTEGSKVKVLGMPAGELWQYGYSWSGDRKTGWINELYQSWVKGNTCLPALLIHPVSGA
jgi:hypothetical protein